MKSGLGCFRTQVITWEKVVNEKDGRTPVKTLINNYKDIVFFLLFES